MRIVYFIHQFFPEFASGTERVTLHLAQAMQRAGHQVHVLGCFIKRGQFAPTIGGPIDGVEEGVFEGVAATLLPHARLPASADTTFEVDPALAAQIEQWLRVARFDLVHVMHTMRMASAIAAAERVGLPLVMTLTDFFPLCVRVNLIDVAGAACSGPEEGKACARKCLGLSWSAAALQQRVAHARGVLARAGVRVVPSTFVAQRYREALEGGDFTVIAHGVDLPRLARAPSAPPTPLTPDAPLQVGFIGSLIPAKGVHVLLQALALRPRLRLRLSVAGAFHGDADYEATVRGLAAADGRVRLLGQCAADEVAALLRQLDLLCLPSLVPESYSLVFHEAAALQVPSLVSARGAPREAIRASGAGDVVDEDTPEAWAQALDAWSGDSQRRRAMRRAVQLPPRVEEEAFYYESLYRRALAQPRG